MLFDLFALVARLAGDTLVSSVLGMDGLLLLLVQVGRSATLDWILEVAALRQHVLPALEVFSSEDGAGAGDFLAGVNLAFLAGLSWPSWPGKGCLGRLLFSRPLSPRPPLVLGRRWDSFSLSRGRKRQP